MAPPCVLVEMGSGNSEKSRMIVDVILRKQTTLNYIPVDISAGTRSVTGSTTAATPDNAPFCGTSNGSGGGVWYTFVGNGNFVELISFKLEV